MRLTRSNEQEACSGEPHRDWKSNLDLFEICAANVYWLDRSANYAVSKNGNVSTHVLFSWLSRGSKTTTILTLNEPYEAFRKSLAHLLNSLGAKGVLCHRLKENQGSRRQTPLLPQQWNQVTMSWDAPKLDNSPWDAFGN